MPMVIISWFSETSPPPGRRGYLGDVQGYDHRRESYPQTEQEAAEDYERHAGREGHGQGPQGEDDGGKERGGSAAEAVGERAA